MKHVITALLVIAASTVQANAHCREIKVKDHGNIAPCSVPTSIKVCDPFTCCEVELTVCMPKGCKVCPEVRRSGKLVRYSFGKHEVEIHFSKKRIVVDYDD